MSTGKCTLFLRNKNDIWPKFGEKRIIGKSHTHYLNACHVTSLLWLTSLVNGVDPFRKIGEISGNRINFLNLISLQFGWIWRKNSITIVYTTTLPFEWGVIRQHSRISSLLPFKIICKRLSNVLMYTYANC